MNSYYSLSILCVHKFRPAGAHVYVTVLILNAKVQFFLKTVRCVCEMKYRPESIREVRAIYKKLSYRLETGRQQRISL